MGKKKKHKEFSETTEYSEDFGTEGSTEPKVKSHPSSNSVKEKVQNYKTFSAELHEKAEVLARDGKQKMDAKISKFSSEMRDGKKKMDAAVSKLNSEIEEQRNKNDVAVRKFNSGVEKLQGNIKRFGGEINSYSKEFWG